VRRSSVAWSPLTQLASSCLAIESGMVQREWCNGQESLVLCLGGN
jgi:hypothetical protein